MLPNLQYFVLMVELYCNSQINSADRTNRVLVPNDFMDGIKYLEVVHADYLVLIVNPVCTLVILS